MEEPVDKFLWDVRLGNCEVHGENWLQAVYALDENGNKIEKTKDDTRTAEQAGKVYAQCIRCKLGPIKT